MDDTVSKLEDDVEEEVVREATKRKVFRKVKVSRGGESDEDSGDDEEIVEIRTFVTPPARVSARVGVTMSRAYQSLTVAVEYSIPEYKEFIDEAGQEAYERAKQHLFAELPEMRKFLGKLRDL